MKLSCIAIDDEPLALSKLTDFIEKVPDLNLVKSFDNPLDAIVWLRKNQSDIIFLDIQMDHLTGIQFLEVTGPISRIIITSAYDSYALKGFEFNVTDYLLKPYSFQRFMKAVEKVFDYYSRIAENEECAQNDTYIFVKTEYRLERIDLNKILYIEGMKDYQRIICSDKKIMTLQSFSKLEKSLPAKKFCRVHKSYIVAIEKVETIERGIIRIGDQRIPISNTFKDRFFGLINK
jgi:two-component system, LytTR family, response regulator